MRTAFFMSMEAADGGGKVNCGETSVAEEKHPVNQCPHPIASPVDGAVMRPLHDRPNRPENSNSEREPDAQRMSGYRNLVCESPCQRSENRERDRNEIDMNLENFAHEKGHRLQIAAPVHEPDKEEIEHHDAQLSERRQAEEEFESHEFHCCSDGALSPSL